MKSLFTLCYVFFICFSITGHAEVNVVVNGLKGELEDNVDAYLSGISPDEDADSLRLHAFIRKNISQALEALGYYHASVKFQTDGDQLSVFVTPGEPTRIHKAQILISGEAEHDDDFARLSEESQIQTGAILNHAHYEKFKSDIRNLALKKGYFNGKFTQSRIEVRPDKYQATIILSFDSGIRYQFGQTIISGSQINEQKVLSLQPFQSGDPYRISLIGEFNQNLSDTDWFGSIAITPDLSKIPEERELPVNVVVTPASKNQLETGLGYSTDVGIQGSLKWVKPWLNEEGHSLSGKVSLSGPEQVVTAGYKIPLQDVLHQYYQIQYGLKKVDNLDTKSIESNLSLERHWHLDNGWNRTVFIRYLIENYEQGILDDTGQFVLPGITFTRTRTRGKRLLTWGDKETLTIEYGNQHALSETDLLRVQGGTSWIRTYQEDHRFLLKLDGGMNLVDDFQKVSPSLRFFAGGDNSIRGYDYESVSPVDSSGALTGAKYLATASLEYQYQLTGNWWIALFYDYGDAFNQTPDWKRGTGAGIRWVSPIGPVRLDFAWGLDNQPGDEFRLHFTLGPDL
ncbi:Translocation and assembly module TamA precursor [Vibrio aerogenes CECT 7868]|uniref:Translocation and assembly module subunit TamA n=1 Tax=Vibrio aerogenes CECT 7868 TaxID=1216006 RepID=A0A1M5XKC3_9VIBR|nr:autotransporter assembly complex family protein [Vibrio aerogenes]SHI00092.1 Translocation and assembly module TamA precursor [Vibrio aerogenes CECT 7868]